MAVTNRPHEDIIAQKSGINGGISMILTSNALQLLTSPYQYYFVHVYGNISKIVYFYPEVYFGTAGV